MAWGWVEKVAEMKNVPQEKLLLAKDVKVCESTFLTKASLFPKHNHFLDGSQASLFGREHVDEYWYRPLMEWYW